MANVLVATDQELREEVALLKEFLSALQGSIRGLQERVSELEKGT